MPSFTFNTCGARSCKLTCIQATHVRGTASTILTTPCTGSCGGHARICTIRTILSIASAALGGADARPQTLLLALSPDAVMLVYLRSATFLAPALDALVEANARPQTLTHSYLMLSAAFLARVLLAAIGLSTAVAVARRAHLAHPPRPRQWPRASRPTAPTYADILSSTPFH